jgi:hypothetical protein
MGDVITYVCKDQAGQEERVQVPLDSVVYKEEAYGYLDEATTALFVEALKRTHVPVDSLVREAKRRGSTLGPGPLACIETWHCAEPWPVFITIGDECYGEFYPENFAG